MVRRRQVVRVLLRGLPLLLVATVAVTIADRIAPLRALDVYLAAHPDVALVMAIVTLNVAVVGLLLLIAVHFLMPAGQKDPRGQAAVQLIPVDDDRQRSGAYPPQSGAQRSSLSGRFQQNMPQWRLFATRLGGVCFGLGLSGFLFLAGPPCVKALALLATVYAAGWLAWDLARTNGR